MKKHNKTKTENKEVVARGEVGWTMREIGEGD